LDTIVKLRSVFSLKFTHISEQPGYASFEVRGKRAKDIFTHEAGTHRFQRASPTDKRGRTHTSTITVSVLRSEDREGGKLRTFNIKPNELDYSYYRSRGPGGQHKNKTFSAVRLRHISTGLLVHAQFGRSQTKNKETALAIMKAKLLEKKNEEINQSKNKKRREQVGRGSRGEKIRTYNVKKDLVVDHRSGCRASFKRFAKGYITEIHS